MTTADPFPAGLHRIFVYGTLKRGGANHSFLAAQRFVAEGSTIAGFVLHELDGYPGMVRDPGDQEGVTGEIWDVDSVCLAALDHLEGTAEGLYRRERIPLRAPHASWCVEAYVYAQSVSGRRRVGGTW